MQFAVLAAALASAEASRFSTGALTLDDYQQAVDARPVVPSTGDLSKKLSHALGALEAALASCSSPDVAHKVQDAAALVAGLAARPASATRRGKRKSPDVLLSTQGEASCSPKLGRDRPLQKLSTPARRRQWPAPSP